MNKKLAMHGRTKVKGYLKLSISFFQVTNVVFNILITTQAAAITKTTVASGKWNNSLCWMPSGMPLANDDVVISNNNTITLNTNPGIHNLTVSTGGKLIASSNKTLNISGDLTVNGEMEIIGGNLNLLSNGSAFSLGPRSILTWSPAINTSLGATLFTNGIENFDPSSTLIIKKWYDYSIPLGEVVNGNFGNLVINTPGGTNSIVEWNQKNKFESHLIKGTLTIDQGWITLDKTGSISSTILGNIILTSINSTFIAHSGNHPSSFKITTASITNNGGNFYGLIDGNGNITLKVSGDFNNLGNVKLINNSGVSGVSNGNVTMVVDGDFNQSGGDTRLIYNVTTTNSGTFNATFRNLNLSGGIFMGQSAIHTGGHLNLLNVLQDFTVNFNKAKDKFRGSALTSIGKIINNAGIAINVGRDLNINGILQAEFTSSASSGDELFSVHRNMSVSGCTNTFNHGTSDAAHSTEIYVQGNLSILGGASILSKNNGKLHSVITKDLYINNGDLIIKCNSGPAALIVNGRFKQDGGNIIFHSNVIDQAHDIIKVQINGCFNQSGGKINFDDNSSGAENILSLSGDTCLLSGNGIITHAVDGASTTCGQINFEKEGTIFYQKVGNNHLIDQVIQSVNQQCELLLKNENINLASFSSPDIYALKIQAGGRLTLNNATLSSNSINPICKLFVDSAGTISLTNEEGLYGKNGSVLKTGVNYFLHKESVVEYAGNKFQSVSGLSIKTGLDENKYGILRINSSHSKYYASLDDNIFVRSKLELIDGKLNLNNHTLTVENGNTNAVYRIKGFIDSDGDSLSSKNLFCWKNMKLGIHEFPFGKSVSMYIPVIFNLKTGAGKDVVISTCRTNKNNDSNLTDTGFNSPDISSIRKIIVDRYWTVNAPETNSDITLTYSFDENILRDKPVKSTPSVMAWNGSIWISLTPSGNSSNKFKNTITLKNVINAKVFFIVSEDSKNQFELKLFDATRIENEVLLSWETINETNESVYKIEKSADGINYYEIGTLENNLNRNNLSNYNFSDKKFNGAISYYRLKYINNNNPEYSEVKIVKSEDDYIPKPLKINSVSPNPFSNSIKVQYKVIDDSAMLEIIDAAGRRVFNTPLGTTGTDQGYSILNLESLKKGIYFLNIINNGKKDTVKIIKND